MLSVQILVATLAARRNVLEPLLKRFTEQIAAAPGGFDAVDVVILSDAGEHSIGEKRNALLRDATAEYVAFFDDDDWPSPGYVKYALDAAAAQQDCAALYGKIYSCDKSGKISGHRVFEHSLAHTKWYEAGGVYFRPPNHLNLIRRDIAVAFPFKDISHGEDHNWSNDLAAAGVLKTQYAPDDRQVIYHYGPSGDFLRFNKAFREHVDASYE